jgi:uncharacterized protein (DUF4415 family)
MPKLKKGPQVPTAAENTRIEAGIAADSQNPEMSGDRLASARSASELFGPEVMQSLVAMRRPVGRPKADTPKVFTAIRLDADVLAEFKATGKGWQTRMNAALKDWLKTHSPA